MDTTLISTIELENSLKKYRADIQKTFLSEFYRHRNSSFYKPLLQALEGGRRIRPLILVLSAECVGNKGMNPLPLSIVMELCHLESLIHDDLMDHETLRRGKIPFYIKYGLPMTILSADYILGIIFQIVSKYNSPRISDEIARTVFNMCEGEINDVKVAVGLEKLEWDKYLYIVENKTASLFHTSAKTGAIVGGGSEEEINALSDYGMFLGLSYQIKDDITDFGKENDVSISYKINGEILSRLESHVEYYSKKAVDCLKILKECKAREYLSDLARLQLTKY